MRFSEKCADPDEKSYNYACGNSSRPSLFAKVPLLGESTKGKQNYLLTVVFQVACLVVSYVIYTQHVSQRFCFSGEYLTLCMLSNVFFSVLNIS